VIDRVEVQADDRVAGINVSQGGRNDARH
jgi:hypothetical protein